LLKENGFWDTKGGRDYTIGYDPNKKEYEGIISINSSTKGRCMVEKSSPSLWILGLLAENSSPKWKISPMLREKE